MNTKLCGIAVVCLMAFSATAFAANMSVQSEKAALRATAAPFGATTATLAYGDQVAVIAEQGAWMQVRTATGAVGWMQKSSLSPKKIVLKAGAQDVNKTASGEELALAGKGFNSKVEGEFKANNPTVDFKWIDYMEKITVSEAQMVAFLKQGGLAAGGGR